MAFTYRNGVLSAEQVSLDDIARRFGTPCYVYSRSAIESAYREYARALQGRDSLVCYSVKANSNLAILALLARLGAFGRCALLVSGINPGANVGRAVYHSGTVGAVLTARNGGISGVAVSQAVTIPESVCVLYETSL